MLLSLGVADAYGIAWEFIKEPEEHGLVNDLQSYQTHPRYGTVGELVPSQYTDDTLRSIATANVVINRHYGSLYDPLSYVAAIQAVFRNDRRKGWSKRFYGYLEANVDATPEQFLRGITKRASSNGALMGCLPLGYLKDPVDVKLAALAQAISTHSIDAAGYAQRLALAAHFFINGGRRDEVEGFVNHTSDTEPCFDYEAERPSPVSMGAGDTEAAVFYLLLNNDSLSDILMEAVDIGGDTDSVAALAVGIASCCNDYAHDLPEKLVRELDHGKGAVYLQEIDKLLRGTRV